MWPHEIETTVLDGLPVLVRYAVHGEDRPASWNGPADYAEMEYEICDESGRYAAWIEAQMTESDRRELEKELWRSLEWTP